MENNKSDLNSIIFKEKGINIIPVTLPELKQLHDIEFKYYDFYHVLLFDNVLLSSFILN